MTFVPAHRDLVSVFEASIAAHGARPFLGEKRGGRWEWITYRAFADKVATMRGALASLGVAKGDRVAIIANNRVEWAICAWAVFTLGAVNVAMYEVQLEKDWKYILADSEAQVCFCSTDAIFDKVSALKAGLPRLAHVVGLERRADDATSFAYLMKSAKPHPPARVVPEDVAVFIYTSGTTGNPKGVRLSHSNLASNVSAMKDQTPLTPDDRGFSILPWAHAGGLAELNAAIFYGVSLGICEGVDKIAQNLLEVSPTWLVAVPRVWHKFHDGVQKNLATQPVALQRIFRRAMRAGNKRRKGQRVGVRDRIALAIAERVIYPKIRARLGGRLRYATSGAAALSLDVAEFIENLGIPLREVYGMTELSPVATAMRRHDTRLGSVGTPLPGVTIKLDHDVAGGDADNGEIIVYGHGVMLGYHNLPDETAKAMTPDGGLRTGDLGRIDADGFLYITGRVKEVYKLENGKFVAPVPIEEKVCLSPYIAQAMVYGLNMPHNVGLLVADVPSVTSYCKENGIACSDVAAMLEDARVRSLIAREIDRLTKEGFKGYDRIKDFALIAEEFSTQNDMLTPTLKLKRRRVMERHGDKLMALYAKTAQS